MAEVLSLAGTKEAILWQTHVAVFGGVPPMRSKCLILFVAILLPAQESTDLLDGRVWLARGVGAYKNGQFQPAAEAFQKAVEMNPGERSGHLYLGSIWMSQYSPATDSAKNLELA